MEEKNQQQPAQPIGNLLSKTLNSLQVSASTPNERLENSAITTMPKETSLLIGMPLSETGLETLRTIGRGMLQGKLIDDKALQALFALAFEQPPCLEKSHDADYNLTGMRVEIFEQPSAALVDALEFFNSPCGKKDLIASEVTRLCMMSVRRNEDELDVTMKIAAFIEELSEYPFDVVKNVCRDWPRKSKWQPSLFELRTECENRVIVRRALLEAVKRPYTIRIEKRDDTDWRNVPRSAWEKRHVAAYAADMRAAAETCRKTGTGDPDAFEQAAADAEKIPTQSSEA